MHFIELHAGPIKLSSEACRQVIRQAGILTVAYSRWGAICPLPEGGVRSSSGGLWTIPFPANRSWPGQGGNVSRQRGAWRKEKRICGRIRHESQPVSTYNDFAVTIVAGM